MRIPNWLIPSGELVFSGGEKKLHAVIGALGGKLREDGGFTCRLGGGAASFRFKMVSVFSCRYDSAPEGIRVSFEVRPAPSALVLFCALVLAALFGAVTANWELAGYTLCLLGLLVFLYAIQRENCIEQFCAHFCAD